MNNSLCSEMTHSDTESIKGNGKLMETSANTLLVLYETKSETHSFKHKLNQETIHNCCMAHILNDKTMTQRLFPNAFTQGI